MCEASDGVLVLELGMVGQNLSFGQGRALCRDTSCYSDRHLLLGTSLWCSGQEESDGWVLWPERCGFASSLFVGGVTGPDK